jgi:hypothetical protein
MPGGGTWTLGLIAECAPQSPWCKAKREPGGEAHLISMAESWLRLAVQADQTQALMDHSRPVIPRNPNLDSKQQNEMEAHSPNLDQLRKNAAECIRLAQEARTSAHKSFFSEMAERWVGLAEHAEKTQDR